MKLINEVGKVTLFESEIRVDRDLPKYKELSKPNPVNSGSTLVLGKDIKDLLSKCYPDASEFNIKISEFLLKESSLMVVNNFYTTTTTNRENKRSGILKWFKKKENNHKVSSVTLDKIIDFFSQVKLETGKDKYISRIAPLLKALVLAQKSGQEARKEKIFKSIIVNKYESILIASGFDRSINEENLVKLAKGVEKEIRIVYISEYVNEIPENIINKKVEADKLHVFDNYVIMYYGNPEANEGKTDKQMEAERDPVLFGIIKNSNRLYYIGDWITPEDDLTWDTIEGVEDINMEDLKEIKIG